MRGLFEVSPKNSVKTSLAKKEKRGGKTKIVYQNSPQRLEEFHGEKPPPRPLMALLKIKASSLGLPTHTPKQPTKPTPRQQAARVHQNA
jgi:hypothetical protein